LAKLRIRQTQGPQGRKGDTGATPDTANFTQYGTRILYVDAGLSEITGHVYTTVQGAITYAGTQTPAASSPWLVVIKPGIYVEVVTCAAYVDLIGEGIVEIQHSTASTGAVVIGVSNVTIRNVIARATAGANVSGFRVTAAVTGIVLDGCQGIADAACTGATDGLLVTTGSSLSGEVRNCYFESDYDGANFKTTGTLRVFNSVFYGTQSGDDNRACGLALTNVTTGLMEFHGCRFEGATTGAGIAPSYGVYLQNTTTSGGIFRFFGCHLRSSIVADGSNGYGIASAPSAAIATTVELHNCRVVGAATGTSAIDGLSTSGTGTPTVNMYGGSIAVSGGGTNYDANNGVGTIALYGTNSGGAYNGTITHSGELQASVLRSGVATGTAPLIVASTTPPTNLNVLAANIPIVDAGGYLTAAEVEAALQEMCPKILGRLQFSKTGTLATATYFNVGAVAGGAGGGASFVMLRAGSFVGLSIGLSTAPGAGNSCTFDIYKNNVAIGLTVTISNTDTTGYSTQAKATDTYVAGDKVQVVCTNVSAGSPAGGVALVEIWE